MFTHTEHALKRAARYSLLAKSDQNVHPNTLNCEFS